MILFFMLLFLSGCDDLLNTPAPVQNRTHKAYTVRNSHGVFHVKPCKHIYLSQTGIASYYGKECHGKKTASGMIFNMNAYTAAHKTAHMPSVALVTHGKNSRVVLINDRGPFAKGRILDCSHKLARDLGFEKQGHAPVTIKILKAETLALRQNGGHIDWDGTRPFPMVTRHTAHCVHLHPKS